MRPTTVIRRLGGLTLVALLGLAGPAEADLDELVGTANWSEATRVPEGATLRIRLVDIGAERDGGLELAAITLAADRPPPHRFRLLYDTAMIDADGAYRLGAEVSLGELVFIRTLRATPVITEGQAGDVELLLSRLEIAGDGGASPVGRAWQAVSVMGEPISQPVRITLNLGEDGLAKGKAGCNRYSARYEASPAVLDLGALTVTKRGCQSPIMRLERQILRAFETVRGWQIDGETLYLTDATGSVVMSFAEAR